MGTLDLSGVRVKLDRTDEQSVFLDAQWRAFRDHADAYGVEFEADPEPCCYVVRFKVFEPVPLRLSVIFGETIHNLRSALDHLACRLVEAHGGTVGGQSFPIYDDPAKFAAGAAGQLKGVPSGSAVWAVIEDAQPYKRGDEATGHPLYIVNHLSKGDKHRILNAAYVFPDTVNLIDAIDITSGYLVDICDHFGRNTPLEDGAEVVTLRFDARGPQPDMQMKGPIPST